MDPGELVSRVRHEGRAALMGIVNVTPDSFSDGGRYFDEAHARLHIDELVSAGADILDLGAESTRPGASPIEASEQIARLKAPLKHAVSSGALVSVDTTSPTVASFALTEGARIVNDVSCLGHVELAEIVARHPGAVLLLMHSRGSMVAADSRMTGFSSYPENAYGDVVHDVLREWQAQRDVAVPRGLNSGNIWFDPGIGFHKNADQSLDLLRHLEQFRERGLVTVVGASRKSFIGAIDGSKPEERLGGTIAACLLAAQKGADVLRVHDVREVRQAIALLSAVECRTKKVAGAR